MSAREQRFVLTSLFVLCVVTLLVSSGICLTFLYDQHALLAQGHVGNERLPWLGILFCSFIGLLGVSAQTRNIRASLWLGLASAIGITALTLVAGTPALAILSVGVTLILAFGITAEARGRRQRNPD